MTRSHKFVLYSFTAHRLSPNFEIEINSWLAFDLAMNQIKILASGKPIDADVADQLYALGAKAYLSKPYKMEQLMALLDGME